MTSIYLLRHGATAANLLVPYRLQGRGTDLPLDDRGREQAQRTARALAELPFAAVYSSPLLRARETARIVAEPHGLAPTPLPELTEADLGRWEGMTWDLIEEGEPDLFRRFHNHPGTTPYPDGESFLDVQRRATPVLNELAARHQNQAIVVVGHNVVNRAVLAGMLGIPIDRARAIRQANAGINWIAYDHGKPRVVMLNACLHLGELGLDLKSPVGWFAYSRPTAGLLRVGREYANHPTASSIMRIRGETAVKDCGYARAG